ncbi:putative bifunctional diguanylate cyclase/phosphodiesterase [Ferrimonas gelatinilytica]|uniref:Uncharacterized protein n=1 Tax=Ferrimonas gelatinilytica TaxID=1255257 RepID=A0ABP9SFA4_9GAMM
MKLPLGRFFFSMRWQYILSVVLMLTTVSVVIGSLGIRRFDQQLEKVLNTQRDNFHRDYRIRLAAEQEHLISFSQELHLMMGDEQHQLRRSVMEKILSQSWSDFELFWGLNGLRLYDASSQTVLDYGRLPDIDRPWLESSRLTGEPVSRVRCERVCEIDVAVPVLVDGEISQLVLSMGFEKILAQLVENHRTELAMLSRPGSAPQGPWQRELLSLTNRTFSMPFLTQASQQFSIEDSERSAIQVELAQQQWAFFSWPIADTGERLLMFHNIDELVQSEQAFIKDLLGILLMAMLMAGAVGASLFWRPLGRLRGLGQALPLLAQSRFDELRQRLQRNRGHLRDELTLLESATLDVASQLERLESDVERYTNELQRMAMMDALTGLPNRAMFHHELSKALGSIGRTEEQIALLFLDLDEFKRVNDSLGHDVGDQLLKTVASRLQKSVRSMDTVCRLGGDEFTVIVRGVDSEKNIHRIIHQIFTSLQQPLQLGRHTLIITTSIGVVFCDNPMARPEELLKRADLAMYQAKQAGRSNYRVFNEQMLESASRKLMLEQEIRTALQEKQLFMVLQPVLALAENRVVGFETLVRWRHPSRGVLLPEEFIRDIEGTEQGIAMGYFVIEASLQLLERVSRILDNDQFYIALNLSPTQYLHLDLIGFLQRQLEQRQINPARVVLELTEEVLIKNLDKAMKIMHQIKAMGLQIAIDDFGTGYSSLSYLKQLPFDILKVDRGFVSELDNSDVDRNIVTSVIDLAHNLRRVVVAEGVESHDQRQFLLKAHCDCVQGDLYSAPMDDGEMLRYLAQLGPDLVWRDEERLLGRQAR